MRDLFEGLVAGVLVVCLVFAGGWLLYVATKPVGPCAIDVYECRDACDGYIGRITPTSCECAEGRPW